MTYYNGTYQGSIVDALHSLWYNVISYVPNIIVAVIVLVLGWIIGIFLGKLVFKILEVIKIDVLADRLGMSELSSRTGRKLSIAKLGEWLVKWFFIIGALVAAADILGLT